MVIGIVKFSTLVAQSPKIGHKIGVMPALRSTLSILLGAFSLDLSIILRLGFTNYIDQQLWSANH